MYANRNYDRSLHIRRLFYHAPDDFKALIDYDAARRCFAFGQADSDRLRNITLSLRDVEGTSLFTLRLSPEEATPAMAYAGDP